jgi:hypothetical protein
MDIAGSSEMLVPYYHITWHRVPLNNRSSRIHSLLPLLGLGTRYNPGETPVSHFSLAYLLYRTILQHEELLCTCNISEIYKFACTMSEYDKIIKCFAQINLKIKPIQRYRAHSLKLQVWTHHPAGNGRKKNA